MGDELTTLKDIERYYDAHSVIGGARLLAAIRLASPYLKKTDSVLDIGCGAGRSCYAISDKVKNVTGVDISGNNIKYAKSNYTEANSSFVKSDILTFLKTAKRYSVVTMFDVVEHLLPEERPVILKKVSEITDRAIINIPTAECLRKVPLDKRQIIDEPVGVSEITKALGFKKIYEQQFSYNENERYVVLAYRRMESERNKY